MIPRMQPPPSGPPPSPRAPRAVGVQVSQRQQLGDQPLTMLACGCVLACIAGGVVRRSSLALGVAATAGFPLSAIVDLLLHGGHSLLPIEFAFYAAYAGIGALCALAGRALRTSWTRVASTRARGSSTRS
jgi:hypothetical protein